jgi:hypothetical protein
MARAVFGGTIDLDPASNELAQKTVRAKTFYTAETDGLKQDWYGTVWMNPPYEHPKIQHFTSKLIASYETGHVTAAIVLTNNAGDTGWHQSLAKASSAVFITRGRIKFISPTREYSSPTMGQSFFYLGKNPSKFAEVFLEEPGRIEGYNGNEAQEAMAA